LCATQAVIRQVKAAASLRFEARGAASDAVFPKRVLSMLVKGVPTPMVEANALDHLSQGMTVPDLDRRFEEFKTHRGGAQGSHGAQDRR
jgi:hypothetical protein